MKKLIILLILTSLASCQTVTTESSEESCLLTDLSANQSYENISSVSGSKYFSDVSQCKIESCTEGYYIDEGMCKSLTPPYTVQYQCSLEYFQQDRSLFSILFPTISMNNVLSLEKTQADGVEGTEYSFATLLEDGSIETWGVGAQLTQSLITSLDLNNPTNKVVKLYSSNSLYAALLEDGSVKAWGSNPLQSVTNSYGFGETNRVVEIFPSISGRMSALTEHGTVHIIGDHSYTYQNQINAHNFNNTTNKIKKIVASFNSFAALLEDGSIKVWGDSQTEVDGLVLITPTNKAIDIFSTSSSFSALLEDGNIAYWGNANKVTVRQHISAFGLNNTTNKIKKVFTNYSKNLALLENGGLKYWGSTSNLTQSLINQKNFNNTTNKIKEIHGDTSNFSGEFFVILLEDGRLFYLVENGLTQYSFPNRSIKQIQSNSHGAVALLDNGDVRIIKENPYSDSAKQSLVDAKGFNNTDNKVLHIFSNSEAFAALMTDGRIEVWGNSDYAANQDDVDLIGFNNTTKKVNFTPESCVIKECDYGFSPSSDGLSCQ